MSARWVAHNQGFSLVEVLIVAVLAGLLAYGTMSVISNVQGAQKRTQAFQSLATSHLDIMTLLINRGACKNTFVPLGDMAAVSAFTAIKDSANNVRYSVGSTYEREFTITNMKVSNFVGPATFPGPASFRIDITYRFLSSVVQPSETSRAITMKATVDTGNIITSCWSDKASDYDDLYINTSGPPETKVGSLTILGKLEVKKQGTAGGIIIVEEYFQTSDQRLKSEIIELKNASEMLSKIRGVEFVWRHNDKKDWGFIAQEVETLAPHLVNTDPATNLKSVNYNGLLALSVQAVKELNLENKKLNEDLLKLKKETKEVIKLVCFDNPKYEFCAK